MKKASEELKYSATHDGITGLVNRESLKDTFSEWIGENSKRARALMFVDLDYFKEVNDSFGHDVGDEVLKLVAMRLQHVLESGRGSWSNHKTLVARIGGDEFFVLFDQVSGTAELEALASELNTHLSEPYKALEQECRISASIGISLYPEHGEDLDELMRKADEAMYQVKKDGKDAHAVYQSRFSD